MRLGSLIATIGMSISSMMLPFVASAADSTHVSTLKTIYPTAGGDFVLMFDADASSCTNTGSPKYMYVVVGQNGVTSEGSKKLYAAALTALLTRKAMTVVFDDSTVYCYVNRFHIDS